MEFRNVVIANPARLSIRHGQLCIAQSEEVLVPIEDICTLMLESRQVQISSAALETLAVRGVTVFFCDERHLPSAQLLSMNQFHRQKKLLYAQFSLGKPLQKQLWQMIVKQKIANQAQCLRLCGREGAEELEAMAAGVHSGDTRNTEATAAAFYFPRLFYNSFTRGDDLCAENAALNYGYAILRGCVARNLVMHGLEPCIGIHHHSELNQFNLADDLIEPYRPVVDLFVATNVYGQQSDERLTPALKRKLFNLTNALVMQGNKKLRVMTSVDRSAASLAASILNDCNQLELPLLIGLEEGRYE
jgi:CRISPR-associated protein Cas1